MENIPQFRADKMTRERRIRGPYALFTGTVVQGYNCREPTSYRPKQLYIETEPDCTSQPVRIFARGQ